MPYQANSLIWLALTTSKLLKNCSPLDPTLWTQSVVILHHIRLWLTFSSYPNETERHVKARPQRKRKQAVSACPILSFISNVWFSCRCQPCSARCSSPLRRDSQGKCISSFVYWRGSKFILRPDVSPRSKYPARSSRSASTCVLFVIYDTRRLTFTVR